MSINNRKVRLMARINRRIDIREGVVYEIKEIISVDLNTGNEVVTAIEEKPQKETPEQYEAKLVKEKEQAENAVTVISSNITELKEAVKDPVKMRVREVEIPKDLPELQETPSNRS